MILDTLHFGCCDYCYKWIPKHDDTHYTLKGPFVAIGPLVTVVFDSAECMDAYRKLDMHERENRVTIMLKEIYDLSEQAVEDTVKNYALIKLRTQYANEDHNAEPA